MLKLQNIKKTYGSTTILNNINFDMNNGDIIGLIGKNGAGKTTLMKLIAKMQQPSEGTISYNNQDIHINENILTDFGFMINQVYFPNYSARQNLEFYLKVNNQNQYLDKISDILTFVALEDNKKKVKDYSFGMKQRLCLAMCLITEPKIAVLDEPFVGLDPVGIDQLIQLLQQYAAKYQSIFLISSHQINELKQICNRYLFLNNGEIKELKSTQFENRQLLTYTNPIKDMQSIKQQFDFITHIDGNTIEIIDQEDNLKLIQNYIGNDNTLLNIKNIEADYISLFK
ncbi:ABC transporter ATP-binding protein [Staphylococcus pasteuri]|uniref:ABC transporter ATP-binding protein n=1 Tax=Staphylococcus pasteuri TaxID=45972 RepID=UPI000E687BB9|nr:ABC transporter ATP-binding protein [Staphylococcus pasteuri]MCT1925805.1 ABC transporter ATP-binding protein [Staphylococcus pasteuri]QQT11359.1 ABC transporter ATP-binding protein [Staphylococcus pasteuri]RIO47551.1 ABC transporter ATP-binding protein [Staphylococcus pasteuri]